MSKARDECFMHACPGCPTCAAFRVYKRITCRLAYLSTVWCRLLGTAWKFTKCVGSWRTRRQHRQHRNCRRICHSNSSQCNKWRKCNCRMACKCHRGCSFRCSSRTCPRLAPTNVAHGLVIKGQGSVVRCEPQPSWMQQTTNSNGR